MTENNTNLPDQRELMVTETILSRGIHNPRLLAAMRTVPREVFVPENLRSRAFDDCPLPIGCGQTISQPYIVALMCEALAVDPTDKVLEIGTGSGYGAAILSQLCSCVYTIERIENLAVSAADTLHQLGYDNVEVIHSDGSSGWPDQAPYNGIVVTAGGPHIPLSMKSQLATNGRLVMPVGTSEFGQKLVRVTRHPDDSYQSEDLGDVRFVPLIGRDGWSPTA